MYMFVTRGFSSGYIRPEGIMKLVSTTLQHTTPWIVKYIIPAEFF